MFTHGRHRTVTRSISCSRNSGAPYNPIAINIREGEQYADAFRAISPTCKIPAIVDQDGLDQAPISVFESGAILWYLAEKFGRFLPADVRGRTLASQWLMFQMSSVGPMLGQAMHFHNYAPEPVPYAIERYTTESRHMYGVLNERLAHAEFLAGGYSIADMAVYPWVRFYKRFGVDQSDLPHLGRWMAEIRSRPAVVRAMNVFLEHRLTPEQLSTKQKRVLFQQPALRKDLRSFLE